MANNSNTAAAFELMGETAAAAAFGLTIVGAAWFAGAVAIVKHIDAQTHAFEDAAEQAEKSASAYKEANSELEAAQNNLDEINKQIESIDKLEITDDDQLEKLEREKAILERELEIAQAKAELAREQAARDAYTALTTTNLDEYWAVGGEQMGEATGYAYAGLFGAASAKQVSAIDRLTAARNRLSRAEAEYNELLYKEGNLTEEERERFQTLSESLLTLKLDVSQQELALTSLYNTLADAEDYWEIIGVDPAFVHDLGILLNIESDVADETVEVGENTAAASRSAVKSYEALTEAITNAQKIRGLMNDPDKVLVNGGALTKANYEALAEYVGGEEKLSGVINTNNGYLIENVDKLRELVAETDAATAADVRLARSFNKLRYHKLTQMLGKVVNGTDDFDKATSQAVSAILQELDATQIQIARYSLLEQQLLGVADAYTALDTAKELDAAADYTDEFAGAMQGLIEAFQNHEFGTAYFKEAFKDFIPEDVYSQFTDVGDQLDAGWDYLNTKLSRYFNVETDKDGVIKSVTTAYDQIKQFVKDGLGTEFKGGTVFEGDLEHFDLNPQIKTLKQFADAMGITETAAFALGNAISKYTNDNDDFLSHLVGNVEEVRQADDVVAAIEEYQNAVEFNRNAAMLAHGLGIESPIFMQENLDAEAKAWEHLVEVCESYGYTVDQVLSEYVGTDEIEGRLYNVEQKLVDLYQKKEELGRAGKVGTDEWRELNDEIAGCEAEVEHLQEKARENVNANITIDADIKAAKKKLDDAQKKLDELVEGGASENEIQLATDDVEKAQAELDELEQSKYILGEPTDVTIELALEANQAEIDNTKQKLAEIADYNGETGEYTLKANLAEDSDAQARLQELTGQLAALEEEQHTIKAYYDLENEDELNWLIDLQIADKDFTVTAYTKTAYDGLQSIIDQLARIKSKDITITRNVITNTSNVSGSTRAYGTARARGTAYSGGRWGTRYADRNALVGELGREIYVDPATGRWQTVGDNGAELVSLPRGAIIFNHRQTEALLRNRKIDGRGSSFAAGNAYFGGFTGTYNWGTLSNGRSASGSGGSGGGGGSSSNSDNWFEREYARHNHLVKMCQEDMQDYLVWLDDAYQRAYDEGLIELDDWYSYCQEVFEGWQDLFDDYISDLEHDASLREHYKGETKNIVNIYQGAIGDIISEIQHAYELGMKDTDEFVQNLYDKLYETAEKIKELEDDLYDNASDATEELIKLRIDMIKQDVEDEKQALSEKLSAYKEFCTKHKELLKATYDEEDYLEEQTEKRKAVSDLQIQLDQLALDNSAWATKRRIELMQELQDAQKELDKFERDHAREELENSIDKSAELMERNVQARQDALDESISNAHELRERAIADIQNLDETWFNKMLEYYREYQSGIDEEFCQTWLDAAEAMQAYFDHFEKNYKGIVMSYMPGGESGYTFAEQLERIRNGTASIEDFVSPSTGVPSALASLMAGVDGSSVLRELTGGGASDVFNDTMQSNGIGVVNLGDINISGNADMRTVSEIRRAQREQTNDLFRRIRMLQ